MIALCQLPPDAAAEVSAVPRRDYVRHCPPSILLLSLGNVVKKKDAFELAKAY